MQLVEHGTVGLHEPIQKYVPDFPEKRPHTVTLRHILTHTSGIRHNADVSRNGDTAREAACATSVLYTGDAVVAWGGVAIVDYSVASRTLSTSRP